MSDDTRLEHDLDSARPLPEPGFRGALGRRLAAAWAPPTRPARLWTWVAALALAGAILLAIAASQI